MLFGTIANIITRKCKKLDKQEFNVCFILFIINDIESMARSFNKFWWKLNFKSEVYTNKSIWFNHLFALLAYISINTLSNYPELGSNSGIGQDSWWVYFDRARLLYLIIHLINMCFSANNFKVWDCKQGMYSTIDS